MKCIQNFSNFPVFPKCFVVIYSMSTRNFSISLFRMDTFNGTMRTETKKIINK